MRSLSELYQALLSRTAGPESIVQRVNCGDTTLERAICDEHGIEFFRDEANALRHVLAAAVLSHPERRLRFTDAARVLLDRSDRIVFVTERDIRTNVTYLTITINGAPV